MFKTLAFAIAIAAVAAASAPAQAMLSANGTSLNGITAAATVNGQIIGIELPARTGEAE
jgi:predicted  nucleic acid-binding Zn ribbon protein